VAAAYSLEDRRNEDRGGNSDRAQAFHRAIFLRALSAMRKVYGIVRLRTLGKVTQIYALSALVDKPLIDDDRQDRRSTGDTKLAAC
jgi:hypothetical protein